MGLYRRIRRLLRSNISALRREGSGDAKQHLGELEDETENLIERRQKLRESLEQLRSEAVDLREQCESAEQRALKQLEAGDPNEARRSLGQKLEFLDDLDENSEERQNHRRRLREIDDLLSSLRDKIDHLSSARDAEQDQIEEAPSALDARRKRWDEAFNRRVGDSSPGGDAFDTTEAYETLDEMDRKITRMEADLEADRMLDSSSSDSEKRDELKRLKSQFSPASQDSNSTD